MRSGSAPVGVNGKSWLVGLLVLIVGAFVATGCGGNSSSGNSSTSSAASSGDPAVTHAESVVQKFAAAPSTVGTDAALSKKPPAGKNIIAMSCTLDVCKNWRAQAALAANDLGWTAQSVSFDGTPEDTLNKVQQAVPEKPGGIIINGVPRQTYEAAVADAKAANAPIVTQMGELEGAATPQFVAVQDRAEQFDK